MKKAMGMIGLMLVLVVIFCFGAYAAEKVVAPKAEVTKEVSKEVEEWRRVAPLWKQWNETAEEAKKLDKEGKFLDACAAYEKYVKLAIEINNPEKTLMLVEWGLNNQAYELINEHKKDQKGPEALILMKKAKALLDKATEGIANAQPACKEVIKSNMDYVNDWLAILSKAETKPAPAKPAEDPKNVKK